MLNASDSSYIIFSLLNLRCMNDQIIFLSTEKRSWFYKKFVSGGIDHNSPDNELDNKEHVLMKFFRDNVAAVINKGWVKALIIIIFGAYIAGWYLSLDIFIFYNFSFHPTNDKRTFSF